VEVISEERILGKNFRPTRERPSPGAKSALVTKTRGALRASSPAENFPLTGVVTKSFCRFCAMP
jgi:hypothetical protein